ncbi:hypothetical protein BJX70DRAFT_395702 [Aspergillus crustosus]
MALTTMRAVVIKGLAIETALCGSDFHFYRGHLQCPSIFNFSPGFVGSIVGAGPEVTDLAVGDQVVALFYTSC